MSSLPSPRNEELLLSLVDLDDRIEQLHRLLTRALERVAAHDRAAGAAFVELAHLVEDLLFALGRAAGEDDDAAAIEAALHDVRDARREGRDVDLLLLVNRLGFRLLDEGCGRLHLDD